MANKIANVASSGSYEEAPSTRIGAVRPLSPQPRTLFEDAALAALQGILAGGPDWPAHERIIPEVMDFARAFVRAVREAQKDEPV